MENVKYHLTTARYFGIIIIAYIDAGVAQLIERCLAKAEVTGLSPASRSNLFYCNFSYNFLFLVIFL